MPFDKELARIRLDQPLHAHTNVVPGGGSDFQGCRMYVHHFKGESDAGKGKDGAVGNARGGPRSNPAAENWDQTAATRLESMHSLALSRLRANPQPAKAGGVGGGSGGGAMSGAASSWSTAQGQRAATGHQDWSRAEATRSPHAFRPPSK